MLALRRDDGVIVDATCRSRGERALLLGRLRGKDIRRLVVRCEAPLEVALERAARRMHDPQHVSDATPQIAEEQFRAFDELDERRDGCVLRLDTTRALEEQVAEIARAVDRCGSDGGAVEGGGPAGAEESVAGLPPADGTQAPGDRHQAPADGSSRSASSSA
jgi:hypothetical protein